MQRRKQVGPGTRCGVVDPLEPRVLLSSIAGSVYADSNASGAQDAGEFNIPQQHVWVDVNNDGGYNAGEPAVTTDASGNFSFTGLAAQSWVVRYYSPPGFHQTQPAGGAAQTVNLATGDKTGILFGVTANAASGSITGAVFNDANASGSQDAGEANLPGQSVWIDSNNDSAWSAGEPATTTDASGNYHFAGLADGTYAVRYYAPPGFHQTQPAAGAARHPVVSGGSAQVVPSFGVAPNAIPNSISGSVFNDANSSGAREAGEAGIANQNVWLDNNANGQYDAGESATTTDASGNFTFTGLTSKTYSIRYFTPTGFHQTTPRGYTGRSVTVTSGAVTGVTFGVSALGGGSLKIVFDFRYDTSGFFNSHPDAVARLKDAAASFAGFTDSLAAITPSGQNTWSETFFDPSNPSGPSVTLNNQTVAANTLVVYVAGSSTVGGAELGQGGPGGFAASGSQSWLNAVKGRGQSGALPGSPTDFAPWGGSISFSSTATWNFTANAPTGSQNDFYSVAQHELTHLMGIGTAGSWTDKVVNGKFTGATATMLNHNVAPSVDDIAAHFAQGTMSTVNGIAQEVVMDPALTQGTRRFLTDLDFAALQDLGWQVPAAYV